MQVTHMPPELLTTGRLSKAADSFSWGIILWEMFSGQRPWADMLPMQVLSSLKVLKLYMNLLQPREMTLSKIHAQ